MSALCVFSFVKTSLADLSFSFTKETEITFRIATFCLCSSIASMCSLMDAMPKCTTMAKFPISVGSTPISKSPPLICRVMLPWILSRLLTRIKAMATLL